MFDETMIKFIDLRAMPESLTERSRVEAAFASPNELCQHLHG